ncbi:ABC transporter ATP-binding protein [Ruegeria sp. 2012CJ41-6]|uniref:Spermidine/putrescine import ATP-binding protein PotA n=1 Tax=Ruegeria spongiae TaxID=2942209 RepID=A0ABT0Q2Y9_9RHOB|nr:ABC transporter ATP-binding protein [Ruegeria spongiae]MCL6284167.1 ABC transporter ATP-binding protein [Ruegeria spongiae]
MAKPQDAFVRFENVQKSYDGKTLVIKDLNLDIFKGEFVSLLGPSGSGKTTALMLLAGFEPPTKGTIHLDGRLLNSVPAYHRNIGLVFQNYALFPHLTVQENIAYPLRVRGAPKTEVIDRSRKMLDMVRLSGFGGRYPNQLSGGQQQRVAVARSLVFDPALVLMDEPLGALDKKLREEMQLEIRHIHEQIGITVVFVTHDQDEALTMSDRVAVFDQGRIQQVDYPAELYERPGNKFVASFVGETNMLSGTFEGQEGGVAKVRLNNGALMAASRIDEVVIGARVAVSVRPERIRLHQTEGVGRVAAHHVETIYSGANSKLVLSIGNGERVKTIVSAVEMAELSDQASAIYLSIDPADARMFSAQA